MKDLQGKTAVVTGGASGVGRGIAEAMLAEGIRVAIADIEEDRLQATTRELGVAGFPVNVADAKSVAALADNVVSVFGSIDIVVNNAGVGAVAPIAQLTLDDWRWMLDVNLWGVIHGVHSFLPILCGNVGGGHIVNTASMSGVAPLAGMGAYAAAKSAVVALSESLAAELAAESSNVGVTTLLLGPVRSDLGRSSRNRTATYGVGALRDASLDELPVAHLPAVKSPAEVGRMTLAAIRTNSLYVFTHPELFSRVAARHAQLERACKGSQS